MNDLERAKALEIAWYDYCVTNRIIAYDKVPKLTEEQIEAYCREQYEKDKESIWNSTKTGYTPH